MTTHKHAPLHVSVTAGGTRWEVCACGATRTVPPGSPATAWHACRLCTHPEGRGAE